MEYKFTIGIGSLMGIFIHYSLLNNYEHKKEQEHNWSYNYDTSVTKMLPRLTWFWRSKIYLDWYSKYVLLGYELLLGRNFSNFDQYIYGYKDCISYVFCFNVFHFNWTNYNSQS